MVSFMGSRSLPCRAPCVSSHRMQQMLLPIERVLTGRLQLQPRVSQHERCSNASTYVPNALLAIV